LKVFITGGCGFIGSNLCEYCLQIGYDVILYDNLSTGSVRNIRNIDKILLVENDILNKTELIGAMSGCDVVFHLAALASVPESIIDPLKTVMINEIGTINVLEAMKENNIKNIVFSSSAAIYGNSSECPKSLSMLPSPVSPYAITKLTGEHFMSLYTHEHGFKAVSARFFNVYGENQNPGSMYAAAIPIFIKNSLCNQSITIYGDGEQTRDFIYVKDLVKYLVKLADGFIGVYNLGYGTSITINELVKIIIKLTNSRSGIKYEGNRAGDVKYSYADVSKTIEDIPVELYGFHEGISRTIKFLKKEID